MLAKIKKDIVEILIPRIIAKNPTSAHLFNESITYHINPTGNHWWSFTGIQALTGGKNCRLPWW
jgi:hypothetical protein